MIVPSFKACEYAVEEGLADAADIGSDVAWEPPQGLEEGGVAVIRKSGAMRVPSVTPAYVQAPNKTPEPTATIATPRAIVMKMDCPKRNERRIAARVAPTVAVAQL